MSRSRCSSDRAVVLGRRVFREYDEILTLMTAGGGKIFALARGVKKPASRLKYLLQPAILFEVELLGGEELPMIVGGELLRDYTGISRFPSVVQTCFEGLRFIDLITVEADTDARLFTLTVHFLEALHNLVLNRGNPVSRGKPAESVAGEAAVILGFKIKASSLAGFFEPSSISGLGQRCRDLAIILYKTPMRELACIPVPHGEAVKIQGSVWTAFEKNRG